MKGLLLPTFLSWMPGIQLSERGMVRIMNQEQTEQSQLKIYVQAEQDLKTEDLIVIE